MHFHYVKLRIAHISVNTVQSHAIFDSCNKLCSIAFDMGCWVRSLGGARGQQQRLSHLLFLFAPSSFFICMEPSDAWLFLFHTSFHCINTATNLRKRSQTYSFIAFLWKICLKVCCQTVALVRGICEPLFTCLVLMVFILLFVVGSFNYNGTPQKALLNESMDTQTHFLFLNC